ncbi:MAG: molybdopterin-dependent oxidoreductase [Actinomycetota bacterium]
MAEAAPEEVPARRLALSGFLAGGLTLSFLWAANRIEASVPFPPISLAERVIRLTPGDVATFFIDSLGENAMRLLTAGSVLGFLAFFAMLPRVLVVTGRSRPYLAGGVVAVSSAAAGLAAPMTPPLAATAAASLGAGGLYAVSLAWLLEPGDARRLGVRADPSRRRALALIAGAGAAFAVGGAVLGRIVRRLAGPNTDVALRAPDEPALRPPPGALPEVPGLSPRVTGVGEHYVVDIDLIDPVVEAGGWTLAIRGRVHEPLDLGFADLQSRFTLVEESSVLVCISNPVGGDLVGSSNWTGVRLRDVLAAAGLHGDAVEVVFRCADGYSASLPVSAGLDPSVLVAIGQNGRPLAWEHGFPCRVRAPAFYGVKNAKWVEAVEVLARPYDDYWTRRGWSELAVVRTQSRIDTVGNEPAAGRPTWIAGVAWAGGRGLSRVEVSVDGGQSWTPASLAAPLSALAWTRWAYRWTPERRGRYRVACRAADGEGRLQDAVARPPHPSGASGYHTVEVEVA